MKLLEGLLALVMLIALIFFIAFVIKFTAPLLNFYVDDRTSLIIGAILLSAITHFTK